MAEGTFSLRERVAVVTGAGGWLGADICRCLAAAGAAVAVTGRTRARLDPVVRSITDAGGRAIAVAADAADEGSVAAMAAEVVERLGGIDILVANAAIYPSRPWTEIEVAEWDAVMATNVRAAFLCAREMRGSMVARGHGRIVTLGSTTLQHGFPDATVLDYVTSKGALLGFTRALAREIGRDGVTVNAVVPGAFEPETTPDYNAWVLAGQALKRRGVGADVGHAVTFLAGDGAAFITGQTLVVDGGMSMC
jgi:3-oxoacyl-[acyl-carrier protein] reductase